MRFVAGGPNIPDPLLSERDAGRVVFLCGAGVSIPAGMPTFTELTHFVIEALSPAHNSEIRKAFRPWSDPKSNIPTNLRTPLDQIFNLLHIEYGRDAVGSLVFERLSVGDPTTVDTSKHKILSRISADQNCQPQIVTTNFDHLFEYALGVNTVPTYVPPTFPDVRYGASLTGITYLHGRLSDMSTIVHQYVLSSADFGRAYLAQGWATAFIHQLLQGYTVILLGYQAEDPPVRYLLQGLSVDKEDKTERIYAFDQGPADEIEYKWRDRGVTPMPYPESQDHHALWETLEAWANRADSPASWRSSIIHMAMKGPEVLEPHE